MENREEAMNNFHTMPLPEIEDKDIDWVCEVLGLPKTAFSGINGKDPRSDILKSMDNLDVEACPGSGKTTLVVAKLAILASKWTEIGRGICVLSHTNVARHEIEYSLGSTAEGQRLLSYPHFIGTIHGFVNEFLAIPWLRSKNFKIKMIDDEICQRNRWAKLPRNTRIGLEKNKYDKQILKIVDTNYSVGDIRWGRNGKLGPATNTYRAIQNVCKQTSEAGFYCYDEMFVWANEFIHTLPEISDIIRKRFPLLLIDEVQDNNDTQNSLIHRLFVVGDNPVIRQRFGDANQAIYQYFGQKGDISSDSFPIKEIRKDIPNSFRFSQDIADLVNPFGLEPQNLKGERKVNNKVRSDTRGKHTIFLFENNTIEHVLTTYSDYLIGLFSSEELLTGTFTAIGAIHKTGEKDKIPRSVSHYWAKYDHQITSVDPKPNTFVQYVMAGHKMAMVSNESNPIVEKIAEGILRLVLIINSNVLFQSRQRKHSYILELLEGNDDIRSQYIALITNFAINLNDLTKNNWESKWRELVATIAKIIAGTSSFPNDAAQFLTWPESEELLTVSSSLTRDNLFRHSSGDKKIEIRVGSIHSVKGETHTATLVLETYWNDHNLASLKPWILGEVIGYKGKKERIPIRLKLHYVAMSRPTHLLCLAMRNDSFIQEEIDKLIIRGWRIARIVENNVIWLN